MVEGPPGADSEEKREPVSDIDIAVADSLNALDLKRPIREAEHAGEERLSTSTVDPVVAAIRGFIGRLAHPKFNRSEHG